MRQVHSGMESKMASRQKVLVADDDDAIQICMEDISKQEGWDLIFARDGEECVAQVVERNPSLIILDQRMPRMTGEEVLTRLEELGRKIPVVLISAEKDLSRMKRFPAIVRTLTKPFDLEDFISAVNHELNNQPKLP
jgi:CheY-like chemotaxis protein